MPPNARRDQDSIALNFYPLATQKFHFTVFRKRRTVLGEFADEPQVTCHRLPAPPAAGEPARYEQYWVSLQDRTGFSAYECGPQVNLNLTKWVLYHLLAGQAGRALEASEFTATDGFKRKVYFHLRRFPQGVQTVWLSPYYLKSDRVFGFLADFHFRRDPDAPFDRKVLQLCLSLDSSGRDNTSFYTDRHHQLDSFLTKFLPKLFPIAPEVLPVEPAVGVVPKLWQLRREHLDGKVYVFAGDRTSAAQFQGVKDYGPLVPAPDSGLVCFFYLAADKPLSHDLYRALNGETYPTFPGMKKMFGFPLDRDHVRGVAVESLEPAGLEAAAQSVLPLSRAHKIVPVVLVPWTRHDTPDEPGAYHLAKHVFLRHGLPSQFVSKKLILDRNALKWSTSNIALGVFSKLGGTPWKVRPRNEKCLIVGIGQSHKRDEQGKITRYFAYSVLADSSGLYEDLQVLSQADDETTYLAQLTAGIVQLLERKRGAYEKFTVHTTFKLRRREMDALKAALTAFVEGAGGVQLVGLKFNDSSDLFGYAEGNNTLVPFESSYVRLSNTEFLVWFEGLQYRNPVLRKKVSNPLHVEFVFPVKDELPWPVKRDHLQDALNLTGANWRGFNGKTLPVSVYYAHLLSDYFSEFDRLGLPVPPIEHMTPWFL